jgi:acetoacetate decarboxylase
MTLEGFSRPFSPGGVASIVQPFPWDFAMEAVLVHYRADPEALESLIPAPLQPHPQLRGEAFWLFVDHVVQPRVEGSERWHPSRLRSVECAIGLPVSFEGRPGSYWAYSWTDSDWNLFTGWTFGFAGKLARLSFTHMQSEHPTMSGEAPGASYRATVERLGQRLATATVTLREEVEAEASPLASLLEGFSVRYVPDVTIAATRPLVHDIIVGQSEGNTVGAVWRGDAELALNAAAENEWLEPVEPLETIAGYKMRFGYAVVGAKVVFDYLAATDAP